MKLASFLLFIFAFTFAQDDFAAFNGDEDDVQASDDANVEVIDDDEPVDFSEFNSGVDVGHEMMDRNDDELDPDEFENIPPSSKKSDDLKVINVNEVPNARPVKPIYTIEYGLSAVIVIYIVNYVYGRLTNGNIAADWFSAAQPFLESQFALVGDDSSQKETISSLQMTRDADHVFSIWCSGRISVNGLLATLRLNKRQDAMSAIYSTYIQPTSDRMILRFSMEKMEPLCFVLGKSSAVKDVFENYPDAATFCADKIRSADKLGLSNMSYVAETVDSLSVFDKKMCNLFASAKDSLISLHVSDSFVGPRVPDGEDTEPISKVCIFVFDMKDVQQNATQFLKIAVYFVDQLAKFNLGKEAYEKHKRRRAKQAEAQDRIRHQERQEEIARKKEETRREEYKKMFDEQDPDKQKKLEYDLNKRDLKRQNRKQKPRMSFRTWTLA